MKHSRFGRAVARFGLASRAIVYLTLAALMLDIGLGGHSNETDQGGALRDLGMTTVGTVLLVVFALGTVSYSAWRWAEAALGRRLVDLSALDRLKAFVEGACYLPFGVMAVAVAVGHNARSHQAGTYRSVSAEIMKTTSGRVLVGAAGVVVVIVGAFLFSEGPRRSFLPALDLDGVSAFWRRATIVAGVLGATVRGVVFALAGVLVIVAAVTATPRKAGGIDSAVRAVVEVPLGRALMVVAAVGTAAFGLFALAEARWRVVT